MSLSRCQGCFLHAKSLQKRESKNGTDQKTNNDDEGSEKGVKVDPVERHELETALRNSGTEEAEETEVPPLPEVDLWQQIPPNAPWDQVIEAQKAGIYPRN